MSRRKGQTLRAPRALRHPMRSTASGAAVFPDGRDAALSGAQFHTRAEGAASPWVDPRARGAMVGLSVTARGYPTAAGSSRLFHFFALRLFQAPLWYA